MKANKAAHVIITLAPLLLRVVMWWQLGPTRQAWACAPRLDSSTGQLAYVWQLLFGGQRNNDTDDQVEADNDDDDDDDNDDIELNAQAMRLDGTNNWTTNDWLAEHNYTYELHNVTTADGYRLQMQRLPCEGARPVLLVHGLLSSSLAWVLMGPSKGLGFQLYDRHYDVWLANLRGSSPYGLAHATLNATSADFWSYSFHEQGAYDLPALIDHIREQSSFHQVLLIAHSQAFNALLVLCSLHPIYNERILFAQALAPTIRLRNYAKFSTTDVRRIMKFVKKHQQAQQFVLFPSQTLRKTCLRGKGNVRSVCQKYMTLIAGKGRQNKTINRLIYGQLLQGGSLKEITHLQQLWKSGDFIAYDYGPSGNLNYYNSVESLNYNLSQVKVPMVLHFADTDAFATPKGVHSIYAKLPLSTIVGVYRIAAKPFNHLDFLFAADVNTLVNNKLVELMENFMHGKLNYVIE